MLILLVTDPFLQALVAYEGRLDTVSGPDSAVVAQAKHLDVGSLVAVTPSQGIDYHGSNGVLNGYQLYGDVGMSAASLNGFVNSSSTLEASQQVPSLLCRTGNCTWELYASGGICSSCVDISEHVEKVRAQVMPDATYPCDSLSYAVSANYTNYTIPYGLKEAFLQTWDGFYHGYSGWPAGAECMPLSGTVGQAFTLQPSETYSFQDWDSLLISYAILISPPDYLNNETTWETADITGLECGLRFCNQVYNTSVEGGIATDTTVPGIDSSRVQTSYQPAGVTNKTVLQYIQNDYGNSLILAKYTNQSWSLDNVFNGSSTTLISRTDLQLAINPSAVLDAAAVPASVLDSVFNITQASIVALAGFFGQESTSDSITYALSNSTNVSATFAQVARSMTSRMREIDGSLATGRTKEWVTHIRVRWVYLALPVVVIMVSLAFSAGVVWDSKILGLRSWKTDLLRVMAHGSNAGIRHAVREDVHGASRLKVRLEDENGGLQLQARKD